MVAQGTLQLALPPLYRYYEFGPPLGRGMTLGLRSAPCFLSVQRRVLGPFERVQHRDQPGWPGPVQAANDSPSGSNGKTLISAPRMSPVYDFGHPGSATSYNWATDQLDDTNRCPTEWQILGSNNDSTWTLLSNMTSSPDPYSSTVTGCATMDVGRFLHATSR